jgi:periplasmic copper chaperone A
MRRRLGVLWALVAALALVLAACGDDAADSGGGTPSLTVDRAFVPTPAGANGALYFEIANEGDGADHLIGATTDAAESAQLHETTSSDDGLMGMTPVDDLEIPAGESVSFEPGGLHVMLMDIDDLEDGDTVEVDLEFEETGIVTVEAEVGPYDDGQR